MSDELKKNKNKDFQNQRELRIFFSLFKEADKNTNINKIYK